MGDVVKTDNFLVSNGVFDVAIYVLPHNFF